MNLTYISKDLLSNPHKYLTFARNGYEVIARRSSSDEVCPCSHSLIILALRFNWRKLWYGCSMVQILTNFGGLADLAVKVAIHRIHANHTDITNVRWVDRLDHSHSNRWNVVGKYVKSAKSTAHGTKEKAWRNAGQIDYPLMIMKSIKIHYRLYR
jgi:hypothetical protein